MAKHYDLIVIGAGSGNAVVDERFADWSVAIVEEHTFGGTCLNRGCIPSKMYVYPADVIREAETGPGLGVRTSDDGGDWTAVRQRIFEHIDRDAASGLRERRGQENVEVHTGSCRFTGPRALTVALEVGGTIEITADHVVIAAGSRPSVPDVGGLDQLVGAELHTVDGQATDEAADWYTSDTILRMPELPARVGVVGGGYVGVELAHVMSAYGSKVTQVETSTLLLGSQDSDIAARFTEIARRQWDVLTDVRLDSVARTATGLQMRLLRSDDDDDETTVEVDALLLAVGRRPNGDHLDLAAAGVEVDDRGVVVVDSHQRTTAHHVWALGDVSSSTPLKHAANQDARVVQHNLLHPDDLVVSDHDAVPQAVFSRPQVAAVGLTETQAREQGVDVAVAVHEYAAIAYGWAMMEDQQRPRAFVKLVADRATGLLVGAHLIGPQASVLVQPLILALSHRIPVAGLARSMYWIHPSLTEVVEGALLELEDALAG